MAISNIDNVKTGIETDINNGVPLIDGNTVRDNMVDTLESVNAASGILFEYVASVGDLASGKFTMLENDGTTVTADPSDAEFFAFYENDISGSNISPLVGLDDFAVYMRSNSGYSAMFNASDMIASSDTVISCGVISPKEVGTITVDEVVKFEFLNKYDSGVTADLQTVLDNGSTADVSAPIVVTTSGNNDIDIYTNDSGDLNVGAVGTGDARLEAVDGEVRVRSLNSGVVIDGGVGVDIDSGTGDVNINGSEAINAADAQTITGVKTFDTSGSESLIFTPSGETSIKSITGNINAGSVDYKIEIFNGHVSGQYAPIRYTNTSSGDYCEIRIWENGTLSRYDGTNDYRLQTSENGTTGNRPSSPVTGEIYFNTDNGVPEYYNGSSWVTGMGTQTVKKRIEIGAWNMDSFSQAIPAHGLSATEWKTISNISATIFNDAETDLYSFEGTGEGNANKLVKSTSSNIVLQRPPGSFWDSTDFDDGTMNRGFITFDYIPD